MSNKSTGKQNNVVVQGMTQRQRILLKITCREIGVGMDDVVYGGSREKNVILAKHMMMYLLKQRWGLSYAYISKMFIANSKKGKRLMDHTSAMHGVERIERELALGYDNVVTPYNRICSFLENTSEKQVVGSNKITITVNDDFHYERLIKVLNTHYRNLKYEIG
jgi:hypothetical protein